MYGSGGVASRHRNVSFGTASLRRGEKRPAQEDARSIVEKVRRNGLGVDKNKREMVTATERKQHLIVGISTNGSTISSDGSEFSINLNKFPLSIPSEAFNVGARLVDLVVPYTWPNLSNTDSEQLRLTFQDEKSYKLDDIPSIASSFTFSDLTPGGSSQTTKYAFDGTIPASGAYSTLTAGSFSEALTEQPTVDGFTALTGDLAAADASLQLAHDKDFVQHLVWEEKDASGNGQIKTIEVVYDAGHYQVYRKVNPTSGFQELWIRFYLAVDSYYEKRLSGRYQMNKTNVLTVVRDASEDKVFVIYNDMVIVDGASVDIGSITGKHHWLATSGMHSPTTLILAVVVSVKENASALFNQGATTGALSLGYPSDQSSGEFSFWYQHAILMSKYKSYEVHPHVKVAVSGRAGGSGSYEEGDIINIPILHEDDNSLTFVTIPTLLEYMQRVVNQFVFREFFFSQFLSVDLIENHTNSSLGTNYLIQFDYDLRRSSSVSTLKSPFTMAKALYNDNNQMKLSMSPAPYYFYDEKSDVTAPDMLTIVYKEAINGSSYTDYTYVFDLTDLSTVDDEAQHESPESDRDYIVASRTQVAKFVYESLRKVFIERGVAPPSPWASRSSQPSDSPIRAFYDDAATEGMDIDMDATVDDTQANTLSYTFQFKDSSDWVDSSGVSVNHDSSHFDYITINASGLIPDTDTSGTSHNTTNVKAVSKTDYSSVNVFLGSATKIGNDGSNAYTTYSVFNEHDSLDIEIGVEDGLYDEDYLNAYLEREVNDFFHTSSHGLGGDSALVQIRGNPYTQQAQIGVLLSASDPALPNRVEVSFPGQTATTQNGLAQMLFESTEVDMGGDGTGDAFTLSAATAAATGMEYTSYIGDTVSPLLPKPTYDDENVQLMVLDYSRVISDFTGIRHEIDPKDENSRIFNFNPFTSGNGNQNLVDNVYDITIPSGSYDADTLSQMIDYLLRAQNPEILPNVIQVRELKPLQKLQFGALVSSDPNNAYPHKVTISSSAPSTPTKLGALLGWDLTSDVEIAAPDYRETNSTINPIYGDYFSNQHNFQTRSIFLMSNFSRNATSPDGSALQILAAFAPRNSPGENLVFNPNQPIINNAGEYLKNDKLDELRFRLIDGVTKLPLAIGSGENNAWKVTLAIEYDLAIDQSEIKKRKDAMDVRTDV